MQPLQGPVVALEASDARLDRKAGLHRLGEARDAGEWRKVTVRGISREGHGLERLE
jgi:hypothetical protein